MNFLQKMLAAIANGFTATLNRTYAVVNNNTAATTGYIGLTPVPNTNKFSNIPAGGLKRLHLFLFFRAPDKRGQFHKLI